MARSSNLWSDKVIALVRGGNLSGAIAQIKVAPSLKDLKSLQAALIVHRLTGRWANLDTVVSDTLDHLSAPRLHRSP